MHVMCKNVQRKIVIITTCRKTNLLPKFLFFNYVEENLEMYKNFRSKLWTTLLRPFLSFLDTICTICIPTKNRRHSGSTNDLTFCQVYLRCPSRHTLRQFDKISKESLRQNSNEVNSLHFSFLFDCSTVLFYKGWV